MNPLYGAANGQNLYASLFFHKAGQGCFYGGQFTNKKYQMVFDCGRSPIGAGKCKSLDYEIDSFKKLGLNIDLLFISHLDYDHVSGLKRLLEEFKVSRIIMPYMEAKYRFLHMFSIGEDPPTDDQSLSLEDYDSLVKDPVKFIHSIDDQIDIFLINPDYTETYLNYEANNSDLHWRGEVLSDESEKTKIYKNNLQFFVGKEWEFTTFVKKINEDAVDKLHSCLRKILKKQDEAEINIEDLIYLLSIKTIRSRAHKCYRKMIGNINSHGLVLVHGPINIENAIFVKTIETSFHPIERQFHDPMVSQHKRLMTALFGDISFNGLDSKFRFPEEFLAKLRCVHIFQVPHHGSFKSWKLKNYNDLNLGVVFVGELRVRAICNYGLRNSYGHPAKKVVKDLNSIFFRNTEIAGFNVQYYLPSIMSDSQFTSSL